MKRIVALFMSIILALSLAGCNQSDNDNKEKITVESTIEQGTTDSTKIVLNDMAGRTVTLEKPAKKIVSCYYISTYATIALGVSDRLVGIEKKADTRSIYKLAALDLLNLKGVGTLKDLNVELVASLEPDIVILPKKLSSYGDALDELGIKYIVVNPENQENLETMLGLIANACGKADSVDVLTAYYKEQFNKLLTITSANSNLKKVYMAGNSSYMQTAPNGMYQARLISNAGGINAADDVDGDYWTDVSYEDILKMNPDIIIIPAKADYKTDDIYADSQLANVKAIAQKQIYTMPSGLEEWDSPVPSGIMGSMWLASILNDGKYSFEQFTNDAIAFYAKYYKINIDKSLITK